MTRDSLHTIHAPSSSKKGRRLHSLKELKEKNLLQQTQHINQKPPQKKPKPALERIKRFSLWSVGIFFALILLVGASLAYLTSPLGEKNLTALVQKGVNYVGKPMGLRIHLTSIRGFWDGKIQIYDLRVYDAYGPWLRIEEGTLHPQWSSLAKGSLATWQYRRENKINDSLRSQAAPLSTLPQNHENTFIQDEDSLTSQEVENVATASIENPQEEHDIVDSLLTAEKVLKNKVVIGLKLGTLVGVHMPRFPKYTTEEIQTPEEKQTPITFLPSWFALDIGEIELVEFQLGPKGKSITISTRLHGQISEKKLRLRTTLLAASEISAHWILPPVQELPSDVTLNLRQLSKLSQDFSENLKQRRENKYDAKHILSLASLDYDNGDVDLRWQCNDSFFTPLYLTGAKSIWSRARFQAHFSMWPPNPEHPAQVRFVSRFGIRLDQAKQNIKASLASGQAFWDGTTWVLRDVELRSPVKNTNIEAKGSAGYTPVDGFGTQFQISIEKIKMLAAVLGVEEKELPLKGKVTSDFYASRGGKHMLWWAKPLPDFQKERSLPGFHANPHDYSQIAKSVQQYTKTILATVKSVQAHVSPSPQPVQKAQASTAAKDNAKASAQIQATPLATPVATLKDQVETIKQLPMPQPSKGEEGLRFRLKIEIPNLQIGQGNIKEAFFTIHGTSADATTAPAGTNYPRKEQPAVMSDFTDSGLPRGLVGTTFLRLGDILGLGSGTYKNTWFVGGAHDDSDVFQARIRDNIITLPGISSESDMSFAYALPRTKRRWPWIDGNFSFKMTDWIFFERLFDSPMQIDNIEFASSFKSFLDETGRPAQYMNTVFKADRVDATQFMVRNTMGKTESKNVHALADTVGLSIGNLREALKRKMEYTPPKDYQIFTANIDLSSGRGGPVRWNHGAADMYIAGEDAHFNVKMLGDINALLEGIFHFRTRTLKLKDMKISTPPKEKK